MLNTRDLKKITAGFLGVVLAAGTCSIGRAEPPENQEPPEETLTLQDSVQRALQNNPAVLTAEGDTKVAEGKIQEAASLFYPKIDYNFNFSKHRNETTSVLPPELGLNVLEPPPPNTSNSTVENLYTSQVGLRQFLFTGGRVSSTLKLAKANLKGAQSHLEAAKKDVALSVTIGFYDVLLKKKIMSSYQQSYQELSELKKNEDFKGSQNLLLEQELSRLRLAASDQQQALENARLNFLNAIGLELFKKFELKGELDPVPVNADMDKLLAWAVDGRPELQETRSEEEVNQLSVDLSLAERNPTVALGAGYELRDSDLALRSNNWAATINLNLPLFDGFSTLSRIRQSRNLAQVGRVKKAKLQDQVQLEVRQAYQECRHWQEELVIRDNERQRVENLMASTSRDKVSLSEWLNLRSWALDAHIHENQAIYEQLVARAKLERAVGHPLID